ncbi:unnamed protein product [Ilex paraguariensis]|uniref:RNase H type-1 domain-containing protein n=1 Tax=Ilex paraguariensis TaxID=185542 RepID=A0ABC8TBW3_9AQUA
MVHSGFSKNPANIVREARKYLASHQQINDAQAGLVEVNFCSVVFAEGQNFGVGVVIRDSNGIFVAGMAKKIVSRGLDAEITAMKEAMLFALHQGVQYVILEGDSIKL